MKKIAFQKLPKQYKMMLDNIDDNVIKNAYLKFSFSYNNLNERSRTVDNQNDDVSISNPVLNIFNYLINFKFIVYHIPNQIGINTNSTNRQNFIEIGSNNRYNCIFCFEGECLIVEQIDKLTFNYIIAQLRKYDISLINLNDYSICSNNYDLKIKDEIQSFCDNFKDEINRNQFVKYTIKPIICYIIRRYFYPSEYFKDKTFFNFNEIIKLKDIDDNSIQFFDTNDFIKLRTIYTKKNSIYYLVIHIKSFYIFLMVEFVNSKQKSKRIKREIKFNKTYSHRCLTKFYGFITENNHKTGLIYEFMCNEDLESYLSNKQEDELYILLTIIRLFQVINYLQSNELIHRDIKPANILIDNNGLPYISDFETIRSPKKSNGSFTFDIGSMLYSSPEQDLSDNVSYPTDIYSFGLIIYFLYEKKHMWYKCLDKQSKIKEMPKGPLIFQDLYKKCVNFESSERPKINEIKNILIEYILSIGYCERINVKHIKLTDFNKFYDECIHLLSLNKNDIEFNQKFPDVSSFIYYIGNIFYEGKNVKQDFFKAKKLFKLSAVNNNADAICRLGNLYRYGKGVKQDISKAREYYEMSAKQNHADSLCYLGDLYRKGEGVNQDFVKAKEYYELSAKQNHPDALDGLGNIYCLGQGVRKDFIKATEYYEQSAKQNNPDALFSLGYFYYIGRVFKKDISKAKEYYEKAAEYNYAPALNGLGNIYFYYHNVEKGLEYYERAAKLNNSNALINLGNMYCNGNNNVKQDYSKAFDYYKKAAYCHNDISYIALGNMYFYGNGVIKDYSKARYYYKLAAKCNNIDGFNIIGFMYECGKGCKKDYSKAIKFYEKAASQNHQNALNNLGNIYLNGIGTVKNIEKAKYLFEKSSNIGNSRAFFLLGNLYINGLGVKYDFKQAKKYYKIADKKGFSPATYILGEIYYKGIKVPRNFNKAKKYFEKAHKIRNPRASFQLGLMNYYGHSYPQNYAQAKFYFESSVNLDEMNSYFYLAKIYEEGKGIEINLNKAIEYYIYCTKKKIKSVSIKYNEGWTKMKIENNYYYYSHNNLGLIYIVKLNNNELGEKYLKESCFNEFPLGQNNYGLYNQFYLKNINDALYFFGKSAKYKFSQPEFNIAHILEKDGNVKDAIWHYLKALEYEDNILIFRNLEIIDENLNYSNNFIICFTSLILFKYSLSKDTKSCLLEKLTPSNLLIHAIMRPIFFLLFQSNPSSYSFTFVFDENNKIVNLKQFFLEFLLFFISNKEKESEKIIQSSIDTNPIKKIILKIESKYKSFSSKNSKDFKNQIKKIYNGLDKYNEFQLSSDFDNNLNLIEQEIEKVNEKNSSEMKINESNMKFLNNAIEANIKNEIKVKLVDDKIESDLDLIDNLNFDVRDKTIVMHFKSLKDNIDRYFEYPLCLEEIFYNNMNEMINSIDEVIKLMSDILYEPPFSILFSSCHHKNMKEEKNDTKISINNSFYSGFYD